MKSRGIDDISVRVSTQARRMRLTVYPDGAVVATVPRGSSAGSLDVFIEKHAGWILRKLDYFKTHPGARRLSGTHAEFLEHKEQARLFALGRIEHYVRVHGFPVKKVNIKNQKTMWGSCTKKGTINLHYKIVLLPPRHADYIIVHELCHLKEFNHSRRFWALVAGIIPDYQEIRKEIKSGYAKPAH